MFRRALLFRASSIAPQLYGKYFTVSENAWNRITEVNQSEGFSNKDRPLRLSIESGGCHGYLYKFAFEDSNKFNSEEDIQVSPPDTTSSSKDAQPRVIVDKHSLSKLQNAVINFHSELKGSAFVVVGNELVDQSCACAMSFSINRKGKGNSASTEGRQVSNGVSITRMSTELFDEAETNHEENEPFEGSKTESQHSKNVMNRLHDIIHKKISEKPKHAPPNHAHSNLSEFRAKIDDDYTADSQNSLHEIPLAAVSLREENRRKLEEHHREFSFETTGPQLMDPFREDERTGVKEADQEPTEDLGEQQHHLATEEKGDNKNEELTSHYPECEQNEHTDAASTSLTSAPAPHPQDKNGVINKFLSIFKKKKSTIQEDSPKKHIETTDIRKETKRLSKKEQEFRKLIVNEESVLRKDIIGDSKEAKKDLKKHH